MIKIAQNSSITKSNLAELKEYKTKGNFPKCIQSLKPLEAQFGCHELQQAWDTSLLKYQHNLLDDLISFKEEKIAGLNKLSDMTGIIVTDFMKAMKAEIQNQISNDPEHAAQFKVEEQAMLKYWQTNAPLWLQKGADLGTAQINKRSSKQESKTLEKANSSAVRELSHQHHNTKNMVETSHQTTPYKTPPLQPKTYQQREGLSQRGEKQSQVQIYKNRRLKPGTSRQNNRNKKLILNESLRFKESTLNIRKIGVASTNTIHNITTNQLPDDEIESLALGIKFIATPKPDTQCVAQAQTQFKRNLRWRWLYPGDNKTEQLQYWIPSTKEPPQIQNQIVESLINQISSNILHNSQPATHNLRQRHTSSLRKLLNRPNILVITADKNLGYAIVDTDWYETRCLEHLQSNSYTDTTTTFLSNDYGQTTTQQITLELHQLVNTYIDCLSTKETEWILQEKDFSPMKFYITAKVHKTPIKGRPIVPSMTWITHHLSQWISNQLNPLVEDLEWVLKDSYELIQDIQTFNQKNTHKIEIYSADVEALYPNMDINTGLTLVSEFLLEKNWFDKNKQEFIIQSMHFVLTKGYISFKDKIYQQNNGAAMGSPMIPPYANIYMYMLEKHTVHKWLKQGPLLLYKRFIDDIIIFIREQSSEELTCLQSDLNSLHPQIKLTWTTKNITCNFLDITLQCPNNKIETNVYQKPLNMYSYLPFHSYHTKAQKLGFIKAEATRYSRLCSRKKDYQHMIQIFTLRLQRRGYPLAFIHKATSQVLWHKRYKYLYKQKPKITKIPLLYKIKHNPWYNARSLRQALDSFTHQIQAITDAPPNMKERVTICFELPRRLHSLILKARKDKGF
jgi:hypothetical protein